MNDRRRWGRGRVAAAACAALLGATAARAQTAQELADLSLAVLLDMEISGASRFATRRSESAATVTVITREEIRALGHRTLADVLRSVRGLMLASDRIYDYVGVRGFYAAGDYNTRVLLLVDGNRVNDSLYDQAFLGAEFPLDLAAIERVEFIPGQGSAVYGANALFGVINVITRAAGGHPEQLATLGLGSFGERVLRWSIRQPAAQGGWQLMASRSVQAGDAVPDLAPGAEPRRAEGVDGQQRSALYARWDHGPWQASVLHGDRDKAVPFGSGVIFGDPTNRYRDTLTLASLQHEQALGAAERSTVRLYAGRYYFVGDYAVDYPPITHNRDLALGRWWGLEARLTSTRFEGHRLVVGLDWQKATALDQQNFDLEPVPASYMDIRQHQQRLALFAEDQLALGERWTLHLGARVDQVQGYGRSASPRVALSWRPAPGWAVKAMHGRAFRAPNAYEAFYEVDAPAGYVRNPALRAEQVGGDELGVEWQPAAAWRLSGSLYRNRAWRLLILDYNPAADRYRFGNAGSFAARGAELELEHVDGPRRWRLNTSWNQDRSAPGSGLDNVYPARTLKGTAVLPLSGAMPGGAWLLGLELEAQSRRGAAAGRALANLTLTPPSLPGGLRANFSLRNAFGRTLSDPGADTIGQPVIPLSGRRWSLELEWPFDR